MEKLLISACFIGQKVRYDGGDNQLVHRQLAQWYNNNRLVVVCPEVAGGLSVPRPPAEIQPYSKQIITVSGDNVTDEFTAGAQIALKLCQQHNIHFALLKESSPSCGSQYIYDGSFSGKKITGKGVTAELLTKHGIKVYSEQTFAKLLIEFS